jgi:hypothetical protein
VSVVRPEFGPTLPELAAPRLRALGRGARAALVGGALLAVVAVVVALSALRDSDGRRPLVVREPIAFNLLRPPSLQRVTPRDGEVLRLQTRAGVAAPQRFTARPLRLAPYRGDVTAALMVLASRLVDDMRAVIPGFVWRGDGRTRVNEATGYQILYQAKVGGRTTYGRRVLVVPESEDGPPPRAGMDLDLRAARSDAVPSIEAVGRNGALKLPLTSFRFGTERP